MDNSFLMVSQKNCDCLRIDFKRSTEFLQRSEIDLYKFLCFDEIHLKLDHFCTIITGELNGYDGKSALITAIQFITSQKYAESEVAKKLMKVNAQASSGYVNIKFLIKDSMNSEQPTELIAGRYFNNIDEIFYQHKGEKYNKSVVIFQKLFRTSPELVYPFMDYSLDSYPDYNNLLHFLTKNEFLHTLKNHKNHLSSLVDLKDKDRRNLNEYVKLALQQQRTLISYEKIEIFKIFLKLSNIVQDIFNNLTSRKYSVSFLIEVNNDLLEIGVSNLNNNTLTNVLTYIHCGEHKILWTSVEGYLKYLLKISTKIAFAVYFNQKIIFIENMDKLKENQNIELVKTAIIRKHISELSEQLSNSVEINYLQKIVDVCNKHNLTTFFEYRGVIAIQHANIVHCDNKENTATCELLLDNDFTIEIIEELLDGIF